MEKEDYKHIDEELAPFAVLVEGLGALEGVQGMKVDTVKLDVPLEFDVITNDNGEVTLGSAPPTQSLETSFMPAIHRMKVTFVDTDQLRAD